MKMATLLEMTLSGGLLIAATVLLRAVAINRLPKTAFLALWGAAFLRLCLPFHIPSPFSIYSAVGKLNVLPRRPGLLLSGSESAAAEAAGKTFIFPWAAAWIAGGVLLAAAFAALHLHSRHRYLASLPVENAFIKMWLEENRLRRPVQVRCSDQIESPLTYGILWPVILLPKKLDLTDERKLSLILAHELGHIRHFHVLFKWLLAALLCVHWFNPLVWAMYLLANRDLELSCDETVLKQYGLQSRSTYALALVEMEEQRSQFTPLASSFSKNALTERITAIMKSRPITAMSVAAALVLVGVVAGAFLTSAIESRQASRNRTNNNGFAVLSGGMDWRFSEEYPSSYTDEQYNQLIALLKPEFYESLSIAEFNRTIHSLLSDYDGGETRKLYETVLSGLPDGDENAGFLLNTVQASLNEYDARLGEAFSGEQQDPEFYGNIQTVRKADVFGEMVETGGSYAYYSFTYRILDQDGLTVGERDAFLQKVMQAAQDCMQQYLDENADGDADGLQQVILEAGEQASSQKIRFTGCEVSHIESY